MSYYTVCYKAGSLPRHEIRGIHSKRALFPYNDSCHMNYSAHKLSEFPSPCSNFNCCRTLLFWPQGMHIQYHHMEPCRYQYLATPMTKGMAKITMALMLWCMFHCDIKKIEIEIVCKKVDEVHVSTSWGSAIRHNKHSNPWTTLYMKDRPVRHSLFESWQLKLDHSTVKIPAFLLAKCIFSGLHGWYPADVGTAS